MADRWSVWIQPRPRARWERIGVYPTKEEAEAAKEIEAKKHKNCSTYVTDTQDNPNRKARIW